MGRRVRKSTSRFTTTKNLESQKELFNEDFCNVLELQRFIVNIVLMVKAAATERCP